MKRIDIIHIKDIKHILALCGLIPFVVCCVCIIMGIDSINSLGNINHLVLSYSLLILSFMAGTHWGQVFHSKASRGIKNHIPFISNVFVILGWGFYLLMDPKDLFFYFSGLFLLLLVVDFILSKEKIITQDYFHLRCAITFIVCLSLLISGFTIC